MKKKGMPFWVFMLIVTLILLITSFVLTSIKHDEPRMIPIERKQ